MTKIIATQQTHFHVNSITYSNIHVNKSVKDGIESSNDLLSYNL